MLASTTITADMSNPCWKYVRTLSVTVDPRDILAKAVTVWHSTERGGRTFFALGLVT